MLQHGESCADSELDHTSGAEAESVPARAVWHVQSSSETIILAACAAAGSGPGSPRRAQTLCVCSPPCDARTKQDPATKWRVAVTRSVQLCNRPWLLAVFSSYCNMMERRTRLQQVQVKPYGDARRPPQGSTGVRGGRRECMIGRAELAQRRARRAPPASIEHASSASPNQ